VAPQHHAFAHLHADFRPGARGTDPMVSCAGANGTRLLSVCCFVVYAVGIVSHILLDLITSFGTMIWSPLKWSRPRVGPNLHHRLHVDRNCARSADSCLGLSKAGRIAATQLSEAGWYLRSRRFAIAGLGILIGAPAFGARSAVREPRACGPRSSYPRFAIGDCACPLPPGILRGCCFP